MRGEILIKIKCIKISLLTLLIIIFILSTLLDSIIAQEENPRLVWRRDLGDDVCGVCWSPDGEKLVAVGKFKKVIVFDKNGKVLWEDSPGNYTMNPYISPDGKYLVVKVGWSNLHIYDMELGKQLYKVQLDYGIYSICWSPDGKYVIVGCKDGYLYLFEWNKSELKQVWTKRVIGGNVWDMHFSPNGKYIAIVSGDNYVHLINLNGSKIWSRELPGPVSDVCFSQDGKYIVAVTSYWMLWILNASNKEIVAKQRILGWLSNTVWWKDIIIVGGEEGYLFFARWNETERKLMSIHGLKIADDYIASHYGLSINSKYELLAVASLDDNVYVYDLWDILSFPTITTTVTSTSTIMFTTTITKTITREPNTITRITTYTITRERVVTVTVPKPTTVIVWKTETTISPYTMTLTAVKTITDISTTTISIKVPNKPSFESIVIAVVLVSIGVFVSVFIKRR